MNNKEASRWIALLQAVAQIHKHEEETGDEMTDKQQVGCHIATFIEHKAPIIENALEGKV